MKNVDVTVITEYANSQKILSLIRSFNTALDIADFTDEFLLKIWDIATAVDYGLDIWGKIVGVSRMLTVQEQAETWGFDEALISAENLSPKPFDVAPFYDGPLATSTYRLSDDAYRTLILAKAMSNITDCSIPNINRLLRYLFGDRGQVFVAITDVMAIRYVFGFQLTPVELAIVINSNAITRPNGVSVSVMNIDFNNTFGFAEAGMQPFENGTFFPDTGIRNANYQQT